MAPKLAPALTLRVYFAISDVLSLHAVKGGPQRMILPVIRGFLRGVENKDIDAELVPGGADYLLVRPDVLSSPSRSPLPSHLDLSLADANQIHPRPCTSSIS